MKNLIIITILFCIWVWLKPLNAQNYPGGLSSSDDLKLWLSSDDISGLSDGDPFSISWNDRSGNSYDASQGNSTYQPTYIESEINGFPVLRFDGTDDYLDDTYSYQIRTVFIVFSVSSSLQQSSDLGQLWGNDADDVHIAVDPRSGSNSEGFTFNGLSGANTRAHYALNSAAYSGLVKTSNVQAWSYDNFEIIAVEFKNDETINRQVIGSLFPNSSVGDHQFGGDIAEIIAFGTQLGECKRVLVENYLATKYNLSISNDRYAYNLTHKYDMAGIGRVNGSDKHEQAFSGGILGIGSTSLSNGEYITMAHDNQGFGSWNASVVHGTSAKVLGNTWKVDKNGATINLDFLVDTSSLPPLPNGYSSWALVLDADGDFSLNSKFYHLSKAAGSQYSVSNIAVNSGDYIKIAAVKNISITDGNFSAASTWAVSVPGANDSVIIAANTTVSLSQNDTAAHLYVCETSTFQLNSYTLNVSVSSLDVYGTVNMGTGTINYSAAGNQDIADLAYYNLSIDGSGSKTLSANTVVSNNLVINSGTLDVDNSNNFDLQVAGNWVNNGGSFSSQNGKVEFTGASSQSILTNSESFYDLEFSGAGPYQMMDDIDVDNQLILTSGIVSTQTNQISITNTAEAAIPTYSNTSFVNGNLQRAIGTGINDFIYPVGNSENSTGYHPVEVSPNLLLGPNTIVVHFTDLVRHDDLDMDVSDSWLTYQSISPDGMWVISPDQEPITGTYDVKLYLDNMTGLQDNQFAVIKRPEGSPDASYWQALGSINVLNGLGRLLSDGYALRTGLTGFSEFGVGTGSSGGGLPVELLNFEVFKSGERALLEWLTATEINSDYFEIQRSDDGEEFNSIAKVDAAGNSVEMKEYNFFDEKPFVGDNYYRLKQYDNDGSFEYLPIRHLYFDESESEIIISVYPNPSNGKQLNIDLSNMPENNQLLELRIFDSNGRNVFGYVNESNSNNKIVLDNSLPSGMYIVDIQVGKSNEKIKWIVN